MKPIIYGHNFIFIEVLGYHFINQANLDSQIKLNYLLEVFQETLYVSLLNFISN
jgi:hypothetical protein